MAISSSTWYVCRPLPSYVAHMLTYIDIWWVLSSDLGDFCRESLPNNCRQVLPCISSNTWWEQKSIVPDTRKVTREPHQLFLRDLLLLQTNISKRSLWTRSCFKLILVRIILTFSYRGIYIFHPLWITYVHHVNFTIGTIQYFKPPWRSYA